MLKQKRSIAPIYKEYVALATERNKVISSYHSFYNSYIVRKKNMWEILDGYTTEYKSSDATYLLEVNHKEELSSSATLAEAKSRHKGEFMKQVWMWKRYYIFQMSRGKI